MKTRLILAATIAVASLFNSAQAQTAGLRAGADETDGEFAAGKVGLDEHRLLIGRPKSGALSSKLRPAANL
mgnify:CR=1 FL=1